MPGRLLLDAETTAGEVEIGARPVFIQRAAKHRERNGWIVFFGGTDQNLKAWRPARPARTVQVHSYGRGKRSAERCSCVKGTGRAHLTWPCSRPSAFPPRGSAHLRRSSSAERFSEEEKRERERRVIYASKVAAAPAAEREQLPLPSLLRATAGTASVPQEDWVTCPFAVQPSQGTPSASWRERSQAHPSQGADLFFLVQPYCVLASCPVI